MAPTYPTSRRAFESTEFGPGVPSLAPSTRALMDWQNFTFNNDLPITPWDTKLFAAIPYDFGVINYCLAPRTSVPGALSSAIVGRYTMPAPRIPATLVRWWFTGSGNITVTSEQTGGAYTRSGSGSLDVPAVAGETFRVSIAAGASCTEVSAYWLPSSTLWAPSAWAPISQAFADDDRPASRYVLRHLAQSANRFMARRAALQCVASYLGAWVGGGGGTSVPVGLGTYHVTAGARVSSLKVAIQAGNTSAGSQDVLIKFDGTTKATISVTTTSLDWYTATISVTPSDTETPIVVTVEGTDTANRIWVSSVSLWETAASFSLPGSETVPAAFVPNDNGAVAGGSEITAEQLAHLVENMVWIWSKRGLRSLICDSRLNSPTAHAGSPVPRSPPSSDIDVQGCRYFAFADGAAGIPRIISATHGGYYNTSPGSYGWTDEPASKSPANTAWRVVSSGPGTNDPGWIADPPEVTFDATLNASSIQPVMTQHAPWPTSSAAEQEYRTWAIGDGTTDDHVGTRVCGLRIEQMPLNSTPGTRA